MIWEPVVLSLKIASIATIFVIVVGLALAIFLDWKVLPARVSDFLDALISSPLVLPPTVLGYYLLVVLGSDSAIGRAWEAITGSQIVFSFTGAVIAATVGSIPLFVRSARLGLRSVEPNLIAAARTLGAGRWRVLFTVVLPLAAPGIVAGAMLGLARALGDYGMTQMVAGARIDGTATAAIGVMDGLYGGNEALARDIALVTTLVGISLLYFANRLTRRLYPRG